MCFLLSSSSRATADPTNRLCAARKGNASPDTQCKRTTVSQRDAPAMAPIHKERRPQQHTGGCCLTRTASTVPTCTCDDEHATNKRTNKRTNDRTNEHTRHLGHRHRRLSPFSRVAAPARTPPRTDQGLAQFCRLVPYPASGRLESKRYRCGCGQTCVSTWATHTLPPFVHRPNTHSNATTPPPGRKRRTNVNHRRDGNVIADVQFVWK